MGGVMKFIKSLAKWIGIIGLSLVALGGIFYFSYVKPVLNKIEESRYVQYDENLTIHEGGGGNSGLLLSDSLILVIDTKMGDGATSFASTVKSVTEKKPVLVVNTHYHIDHTSGNDLYAGHTILAGGGYTPEIWKQEAKEEDMPTKWLRDRMDIRMGDETATIFTYNTKAHTVGDVFVYLQKRKILFAGDMILNEQVPSVSNGDPQGYLDVFDRLENEFDIEKIVPGHGPTAGPELLDNFRQYFNDMKTAANDPSKRDELIERYKSWTQVPLLMSSENVMKGFKKD